MLMGVRMDTDAVHLVPYNLCMIATQANINHRGGFGSFPLLCV